ncbi:MAG: isoprenylcysteine carboxylmethyltransferase family protein [Candidatus Pacebacteria bacterium]|nr:isoprenylcysteine carboxylmethyltransferase family protein [Candidatus Paceibacterota bacterium]
MNIYSEIIAVCWAIFLIVWIISSFSVKRAVQSHVRKNNYLYRLGAVVLIILFLLLPPTFALATVDPAFGIIGVALAVLGVGFALWARFYLGRNWGAPMTLREEHELLTTGPYRLVRHPIYTGVLVALSSAVIVQGILWLPVLGYFVYYFIRSARIEERHMLERFPDVYPVYLSHTKAFIPFVY